MKDVSNAMEALLAKVDQAIEELQRKVATIRKETDAISIEVFTASVDHLEEAFVNIRKATDSFGKVPRYKREDVLPAEA